MGDVPGSEKRRLLRQHLKQRDAVFHEWEQRGCSYPPPTFPALPQALRGLTCGAKTRAGTPCKLTAIYASGRCKWHGGCSTGPKTEAGKEQARVNGRKGGRPRRSEPKP
ncbi:hypothetical protein AZSI13_09390 [Azospira sp. I13]|uniref:HGGxSTG domain-containing protein n=1 Tax=Azospira sp. I13 TaxID=1765050 RepID=UPI000D4C636B|nr:hypothetical protein AZSI13_09390 [Azospira sp. I13]